MGFPNIDSASSSFHMDNPNAMVSENLALDGSWNIDLNFEDAFLYLVNQNESTRLSSIPDRTVMTSAAYGVLTC